MSTTDHTAPEPVKQGLLSNYVDLNFHIFPLHHPIALWTCSCTSGADCKAVGKHPRVTWTKEATTNQMKIRRWVKRFPASNYGIACGPSKLLVIDEDATDAFSQFCNTLGHDVPMTFRVRTGRGVHFYFRVSDAQAALGNCEGALKEYKVNVRGNGGYVVAPDSVHGSLDVYTAVDWGAEIIELPQWLHEALMLTKGVGESSIEQRVLAGLLKYVLGATNGERNNRLNWAAWAARKHIGSGLLSTRAVATALLTAAAHVGIDSKSAVATIKSGLYGPKQERRVA